MTIHIQQERLISDIQQEFNKAYPFLKIGFFASRHGYKQGSPDKEKLAPHRMLKDVAVNLEEQIIDVQDTMSVHELEHLFRTLLGLHVQVFRKSGNLWLETTITDSWTLKQQNDHGREISLPPVIPITLPQKAADNQ